MIVRPTGVLRKTRAVFSSHTACGQEGQPHDPPESPDTSGRRRHHETPAYPASGCPLHDRVCIITHTNNATAMGSKELIKLIEAHGWHLVATRDSHRQYKHPTLPGRVTIPHPNKDLPRGTVQSILKQAGLK